MAEVKEMKLTNQVRDGNWWMFVTATIGIIIGGIIVVVAVTLKAFT